MRILTVSFYNFYSLIPHTHIPCGPIFVALTLLQGGQFEDLDSSSGCSYFSNYRSARQRKAEWNFIEKHFKREIGQAKSGRGPKRLGSEFYCWLWVSPECIWRNDLGHLSDTCSLYDCFLSVHIPTQNAYRETCGGGGGGG